MIRSISLSAVLHAVLTLVILMASIVNAAQEPLPHPCPSSPNCVSSLATDNHFIEPFTQNSRSAARQRPPVTVTSGVWAVTVSFSEHQGGVPEGGETQNCD